ncbi:hypothetical protein C4D60_Mb00t00590 [Musa balbisiana]|uniref:Uncharacterized protein n=1 Tax=Musa balbisiana TaxID=52838 RepID=A0A4S8I4U0_MUSBA|nr:hypothetical protein C4D60_Mb00t00590 [Musa balbisiana]
MHLGRMRNGGQQVSADRSGADRCGLHRGRSPADRFVRGDTVDAVEDMTRAIGVTPRGTRATRHGRGLPHTTVLKQTQESDMRGGGRVRKPRRNKEDGRVLGADDAVASTAKPGPGSFIRGDTVDAVEDNGTRASACPRGYTRERLSARGLPNPDSLETRTKESDMRASRRVGNRRHKEARAGTPRGVAPPADRSFVKG